MTIEPEKPLFYEFADFSVDVEKRLLRQDSTAVPLTPKVFETLLAFLEHRGEVLEKERLMQMLWADSFVEESNLTQNVAVLRKALGEKAKEHRFIVTVPGRGYRFVADVKEVFSPDIEDTAGDHRVEKTVTETSPPAYSSRSAAPTRRWPYIFIPLFLILGLSGFYVLRDKGGTTEPTVIAKTTQVTYWSGLDCYPSISRDGNSVVFSSDRTGTFEIYLKQFVSGAQEVQLTFDGGQNFEPALSPDNTLLAYHSQKRGGIWVMPTTGGTARQLTASGTMPSWSPDGSQIVFQDYPLTDVGFNARNAMPPSTIWTIPVKGGQARQITTPGQPSGGHGSPSYSPDGSRILFDSSDLNISDVWSVSADGSDLKKIFANASDAIYTRDGRSILAVENREGAGRSLHKLNISPSGDPLGDPIKIFDSTGASIRRISVDDKGKRIVYSSLSTASNIVATSISGTGVDPQMETTPLTQHANIRSLYPSFSPDGQKIAYQTFGTGVPPQLWVMGADGNNKKQISTVSGVGPEWSSHSDRIFFRTYVNENGYWFVTSDGAREQKLFEFDGDASSQRISPDETTVAFNSTRGGNLNVWVVPIEGGPSRQLTFDSEMAAFPAWSPDGKWIAVQLKRGDNTHVGLIRPGGGNIVQLTNDKGQSWVADWSPDGDQIIFAGQRDGIWNVYSVSLATKNQTKLTNFTKFNSYVRYPAISPLGDKIAYEYAETTGNILMLDLK